MSTSHLIQLLMLLAGAGCFVIYWLWLRWTKRYGQNTPDDYMSGNFIGSCLLILTGGALIVVAVLWFIVSGILSL